MEQENHQPSGAAATADGASAPSAVESAHQAHQSTAKNNSSVRSRKKLKIKTLEKRLKVLDKHIKKCSEVELSLDEMESGASAYMKEDLYKRKFVATWQELCELVGISHSIESAELRKSYSKTNYPEINRRVQRLIKLDEFPDHYDIVDLIERCDSKYTLGISAEEKKILSQQVFKEVGKILKERRQRDFVSYFGSHLTDPFTAESDPALSDIKLLEVLRESSEAGQIKMEEVCDKFVIKQELELDSGKSPDNDEGSEEEEDVEVEEVQETELVESPISSDSHERGDASPDRNEDSESEDIDVSSNSPKAHSVNDEEGPAVDDEEPIVDEEEPIDDDEPVVDEEEPIVDDEEPIVDEEEPIVDEEEPIVDDEEPVVDEEEPIVDEEEPVVDDEEPIVDDEGRVDDINSSGTSVSGTPERDGTELARDRMQDIEADASLLQGHDGSDEEGSPPMKRAKVQEGGASVTDKADVIYIDSDDDDVICIE